MSAEFCDACDVGSGCEEHGTEPTAMGLIYKRHPRGADRPRVSVWMPSSLPFARVQTYAHGGDEPDTLPDGPVIAHLTLCGVEIGGYLTEVEQQLAAAQEALAFARAHAERMGAVVGTEGYWAGYLIRGTPDA